MDLQSLLRQKKQDLKSCTTTVTQFDGKRFEISGDKSTEIVGTLPFVVDTKPDMQVAMVAPGLYLSSQDPVSSLETLNSYKIGHILSLGVKPEIEFENVGYSFVELLDLPESDILQTVKICSEIIDKHRSENILVHCNAGVSRSASVVISYLMKSEKISYEEAYERVKHVRSCIRPNEGFVKQLKTMKFDEI